MIDGALWCEGPFDYTWEGGHVSGGGKWKMQDLNSDGKYSRPDGEIQIWDTNNNPLKWSITALHQSCESSAVGGVWYNESPPYCSSGDDGIALVVDDGDQDGYVTITEYHCEGLNTNGTRDGTGVACPFDEFTIE